MVKLPVLRPLMLKSETLISGAGHKIHSNSQRIQNDQVEGLIMLAYVR